MEVINNDNGKDQPQQEKPRKTHEEYLIEFSGRLNEILKDGYPLPAIIQVMEGALFEFRMALYMSQMEALERQKQTHKRIEIPNMKIPTNKTK